MGMVCVECEVERGFDRTVDPDESPRLCARHIQKEHGDDICKKCRTPWKAHALKGARGQMFECERWYADAERA